MKAMILAAGFGTRLRPLTETIPKPMIPVVGVPNIVRVIEHLRAHGIRDMVINLHHLPEPIRSYLGDGSDLQVNIQYTLEEKILGTGGGIKNASHLLGDETVIVVNGDVLFTPDLDAALASHRSNGALSTLVVRRDPDAEKHGPVGLDDRDMIRRLVWEGSAQRGPRTHMFTGVHLIEPELFPLLPDEGCIVRETYIPLVKKGGPLYGAVDDQFFCDLGTPERFIEANTSLVCGRSSIRGYSPPPNAFHVDPKASVEQGCRLVNGTVIGQGAHIKAGVTVDGSVVMPRASVSHDVHNCIVCEDGTLIHP